MPSMAQLLISMAYFFSHLTQNPWAAWGLLVPESLLIPPGLAVNSALYDFSFSLLVAPEVAFPFSCPFGA